MGRKGALWEQMGGKGALKWVERSPKMGRNALNMDLGK